MPVPWALGWYLLVVPTVGSAPRHQDGPSSPARVTAPAVAQEAVDFNHPPREYDSTRLQGWDVLVERSLADGSPEQATAALARLDAKLGEIAERLPKAAIPDLQRVRIFLMNGPRSEGGGRESGLEYFRDEAPRHHDWLDPRMASSIVIFNFDNYLSLTDEWALKAMMHEFGHAQHLEHWPEDRADIFDTWAGAIKAGRYRVVREEDRGTHNPNYAAQNHLEYFAELSATYFVGNTYFPRDRYALKDYDPEGFALVESLWGLAEEPEPEPDRPAVPLRSDGFESERAQSRDGSGVSAEWSSSPV